MGHKVDKPGAARWPRNVVSQYRLTMTFYVQTYGVFFLQFFLWCLLQNHVLTLSGISGLRGQGLQMGDLLRLLPLCSTNDLSVPFASGSEEGDFDWGLALAHYLPQTYRLCWCRPWNDTAFLNDSSVGVIPGGMGGISKPCLHPVGDVCVATPTATVESACRLWARKFLGGCWSLEHYWPFTWK